MKEKLKFIDLFAGCGGLFDGFMQSGFYEPVASVEWEKAPVNTLINRLQKKWNIECAKDEVIRFDIQREDELFNGFEDQEYGKNEGLDALINKKNGIDIVIGGPPCQAYSIAGRNADRMVNDYRNYLFEHYVSIVKRYNPKLFVFENVPGMLTAMPNGKLITDLIKEGFGEINFEIIDDIGKYALVDMSEYGIPQTRKRVILVGLNKKYFKNCQMLLKEFYEQYLYPKKHKTKISVEEAIGDLPKFFPLEKPIRENGKNISHKQERNNPVSWHEARYQNLRDISVFKKLAEDIETGENKYSSVNSLIDLYEETTGKKTSVHKYHVLKKDEPSTTILAHLYKDGFRFIHYDSKQARTLTVREAARIQTFDDDFDFIGSATDAYKMIGNAVPPKMAKIIAEAIYEFLQEKKEGE